MNEKQKTDDSKLPPEGLLVNSKWLQEQDVDRPYKDFLIRNGSLVAEAWGVYRRPSAPLKWEAVVFSLQNMGYDLLIGGISALELLGHSHYLNISNKKEVHLYGNEKTPPWLSGVCPSANFTCHRDPLFGGTKGYKNYISDNTLNIANESGIESIHWGNWDWPIYYSTRERAILEVMDRIPDNMAFEEADEIMQGMVNLSPNKVQRLLEECKNVKVKRLFLWFAERHNHAWFKRLDTQNIDLGSGKRMLVKGGTLDNKYQITVPKTLVEQDESY